MNITAARPARAHRRTIAVIATLGAAVALLAPASPAAAAGEFGAISGLGKIRDNLPTDVHFTVHDIAAPITKVEVSVTLKHPDVGMIEAQLIAPNGATQSVIQTNGFGPINGTYVFSDSATQRIYGSYTSPVPSGTYRATGNNGDAVLLAPAFVTVPNPNGTWTLRLLDYDDDGLNGSVTAARLRLAGTNDPCRGRAVTLRGTDASETITGTAGNDVIDAGNGDDLIIASGGNDIACGGGGNDVIKGGGGNDKLYGQSGNDTLKGGAGTDRCDGGLDTDRARTCERTVGIP